MGHTPELADPGLGSGTQGENQTTLQSGELGSSGGRWQASPVNELQAAEPGS